MNIFIKTLFFFITFLFVLPQNLYSFEDKNAKEILVINSYHRGFKWSDEVISGIEKVIYEQLDTNINILYMDSKRVNTQEYYKELLELYKVQLKYQKYDLVIVLDTFAYDFIVKNYYKLFTNEPLLFSGLERFSHAEIDKYNLSNKTFGVLENRLINESIPDIIKIMPKLKKLYIINDNSLNGNDSLPFINSAIEKIKDKLEVEVIRDSTIDKLNSKFSKYNINEAILFIRFYNDEFGNYHNYNKIAQMINEIQIPIFVTDTLFIGKGAIGGNLVLIDKLGELTGQIALDIINKKIQAPYTITADKYEAIFDKEKTDYFKINPKNAFDKFTLINIPLSFFDKYREFINFIFITSPFLFLLILILFYNVLKRIKSEKKLIESEFEKNKHKQFVIRQSKLVEIGEVFSSIAHQWKNPLVEISTIVQEFAFFNANSNDEKSKKFVNDIMIQVQYMTDTINDFHKFIMPSNEKIAFNIEKSIKSVMKIIDHTVKYNYIDVEIVKEKFTNTMVYGYKNEFMQIVLNIINNAKDQIVEERERKNIKRGLITFHMYNNKNKDVVLEISDNGGGVKEWIKDRLFDAYFTTKNNGHGIGLYMAKIIIEDKMQGKLDVFNKDNGLCFRITLRRIS